MDPAKNIKNDTKQVFRQCGTCSRTFFYLLNREFGHHLTEEERAIDPLAGGIMQKGHQCGMLWGAAMAVGAEAYRQADNRDQAIGMAIAATMELVRSFRKTADTVNCRDITDTDFSKIFQFIRYILFKTKDCFNLAEDWTPEAIQAAKEGLSIDPTKLPEQPISCASEVARRMGATDEEMAIVAGLAGGLGLSGEGCGALSAAIWMNSLKWAKEHPKKSPYGNRYAKKTLQAFQEKAGGKMLCRELAEQEFASIAEHTEYIKGGGCEALMEVLADAVH